MPVVINGDTGITQSGEFDSDSTFGFKNRIINPGMVIDQRNAGASYTQVNGAYNLDRWAGNSYNGGAVASKFSVQRSTTAPTGFSNSMLVTSLSASATTTSDIYNIEQRIEGFNTSDLMFGTASAATITISFWVRSSLTGTFGGALYNNAGNRSYPFTYTISSANTWTQISVTIAGDTSGTWTSNNTGGIYLDFNLGAGSTYQGTAGSWQAGLYTSTSSAVNILSTNGATFYITGVQLEIVSTATPFERRLYNQELANCQRYCVVLGGDSSEFNGYAYATNNSVISIPFPTTVRALPTGITTSGQWIGYNATNASFNTTLTFNVSGLTQCSVLAPFTATAGTPTRISSNNVAKIIFNGMEL